MNSTHCLFLTETNIGWQEWISSLRKAFNYIITQWATLLFFSFSFFYALSFYGFKMILDCPNHFGRVPIVLERSNSFWWGPNHFESIQIIKFGPQKSNLNLTKVIFIQPKFFWLDQNNLDCPKSFWTYKRTRHYTYSVVLSLIER